MGNYMTGIQGSGLTVLGNTHMNAHGIEHVYWVCVSFIL